MTKLLIRAMVYAIGFAILFWIVLILVGYALVVGLVGGAWALIEAYKRSKGRPYVQPKQRFDAVWSRGVSPIDPKRWVTPAQQPATDPNLLPGQITGSLRVENLGIRRIDEPGPFEQFTVHARITNHGQLPVTLGDIDHVDIQLWTPDGRVVGTDTSWSQQRLDPGFSCNPSITVKVFDHQPIASWAIGHRINDAPYIFFPTAELSQIIEA
jgi:hypothetical protein